MSKSSALATLAFLMIGNGVFAQNPPQAPLNSSQVAQTINHREQEVKQLSKRSSELTVEIGKVAASGKIPGDQEALRALKAMVDELEAIQGSLERIEQEMKELREALAKGVAPVAKNTSDIQALKQTKPSAYLQFQYRDTDQKGGQTDAFAYRRVRLGFTHQADPRTSLKVTYDFAQNATGVSNNTAGQLREAFMQYELELARANQPGLSLLAGQMHVPLGYEIERSSRDREFPEHAQYNRVLFDGEMGRGFLSRKGIAENTMVQLGLFNAMTINDLETRGTTGSPGNNLGVITGVRYQSKNLSAGISAFWSKRASQQAGWNGGSQAAVFSKETKRQLTYLDLHWKGLLDPKVFLRAEAMFGNDRVPVAVNSTTSGSLNSGIANASDPRLSGHPVSGYHIMVGADINPRNTFAIRYEQFDPNRDAVGDLFYGLGASYLYAFNANTRIMFAHEAFIDGARGSGLNKRYGVTTLRVQFRF